MQEMEQIGMGGFGIVHRVVMDDERELAKKTFSENQPLTPELRANVLKRFSKEVRIQGSISHPNIVSIISSSVESDPPFYLMPLAANSLDKELASDRTLGGNFISVLSDIVAGLEELHSMQIYHRDLKPGNVLRFDENGGTRYAISDFGLISMKETTLSGLTRTGMGKGSDYYSASEIAQELKNATVQSDVFSLGCILHDMVGIEPRVPFREIREGTDFGAILLNCTRDDPKKRFISARAVLDAILSIDYEPAGEVSDDSAAFLGTLSDEAALSVNFWVRLAEYLVNAESSDRAAICGGLLSSKITQMFETNSDAANDIGLVFSEWVMKTTFNFEHSDAIANRLEGIFMLGNFELKVQCLLAILQLGTSHNRWFVERKFERLCNKEMDDNLAKRFVVQMHVLGHELCQSIKHLERSISFECDKCHPRITRALNEICN
jgi:serine/threonine protein kinase